MNTLTTSDFTEAAEPFALFQTWYSEAREKEVNDPDAMTLATVDPDGLPDARMVLLKGLEPRGFTFYTNSESAKGLELGGNMKAALVFHWKSLRRQVRVRGPVEMVSAAEADAYFASRPRDSRIGAWASRQSRPLESRFALEKAVAREAATGAGVEADFVKITDMKAIMAYELLATPGLVIDDKVVSSGRIPTQAEVRQWLAA